MNVHEATAEVFLTAFKALPQSEKNIFLTNLIKDTELLEDILDIAIMEARRDESSRPFDDILREDNNVLPN